MRLAHELEQVVVALVSLREQNEMVKVGLAVARKRVIGGEVDLAAVDGLHLLAGLLLDGLARLAELRHAAHDAVVGDGDRRHVELGRTTHHVLHVRHAVEQGILRVVVQVDKCHRRASFSHEMGQFPRGSASSIISGAASNKPWFFCRVF